MPLLPYCFGSLLSSISSACRPKSTRAYMFGIDIELYVEASVDITVIDVSCSLVTAITGITFPMTYRVHSPILSLLSHGCTGADDRDVLYRRNVDTWPLPHTRPTRCVYMMPRKPRVKTEGPEYPERIQGGVQPSQRNALSARISKVHHHHHISLSAWYIGFNTAYILIVAIIIHVLVVATLQITSLTTSRT